MFTDINNPQIIFNNKDFNERNVCQVENSKHWKHEAWNMINILVN